MKINFKSLVVFTFFSLLLISCSDDYLERSSQTNVADGVVYSSLQGLEAIMQGNYRLLFSNDVGNPGFQGMPGKLWLYDSRCEDVVFSKGSWFYMDQFLWYQGELSTTPYQNWKFYYKLILNANNILKYVGNFEESPQRCSIEAEARTLRAYCYFYLIRLYQHSYAHLDKIEELDSSDPKSVPGVILKVTPDNEFVGRSSIQDCYDLILSDLQKSENLFENAVERDHKSMININVVYGLLARVNLELASKTNLTDAKTYAIKARKSYPLMSVTDYKSGFNNINNPEWIWGLDVQGDQSSMWISLYSIITSNVQGENYSNQGIWFAMDNKLHEQIDPDDVRSQVFVPSQAYNNPLKHKQLKFLYIKGHLSAHVLMRSSEMLLIEMECEARLGNESKAKSLLKELRDIRLVEGESVLSSKTGDEFLEEIYLERRMELWGEGFRFFDLKRQHKGMERNSERWQKATTIPSSEERYLKAGEPLLNMQIPQKEFESNEALDYGKDQNPQARL